MPTRRLALLLALTACQPSAKPADAPPDPTALQSPPAAEPPAAPASPGVPRSVAKILPAGTGPRSLDAITNLDRLPTLSPRHRELLVAHGFFIAPQSQPTPGDSKAAARTARRAKHLFQVYERNDYIRFPNYITADLAIDLTHQYFDVVLRRLEREHLSRKLKVALVGFVTQAESMRTAAKSPEEREAARLAALYWGTALHLLERPAKGDASDEVEVRNPWEDEDDGGIPPAPPVRPAAATKLPRSIAAEVDRRVALVHAAASRKRFDDWGLKYDLTQTKPRGHYTGSGILQRYFRAMSFLGMSTFVVTGGDARPDLVAALTLSYEADPKARAAFDAVLQITNFVVGDPPTAGLAEAGKVRTAAGATTLAASIADREAVVAAWSKLPSHPVDDRGPAIQPIGQRVFGDTLAMSAMLPIIRDLPPKEAPLVARAMGAVGAAAVLGHDPARDLVVAGHATFGPRLGTAIDQGRRTFAALPSRDDAYHRTLDSLSALFDVDPVYLDPDAYRLRMLQSFAGGWAMLRHDTLLYAYQMGAECDAEEHPAPYAWVEPATETYAGLRRMIGEFEDRIKEAGIVDARPEGEESWDVAFNTIETKTKALDEFLAQLQQWAAQQHRGERFTAEQRTELAMVGGFAEHVVLTLADAFELGEGNDDMAVVADVFTFQRQALEVGVGHPELVYAVIPTPDGWQVARGAVLGYRELFVPAADRMTDETWRARVAASKDFVAEARPAWLAEISAGPVGVVELGDLEAQDRCAYNGGAYEL